MGEGRAGNDRDRRFRADGGGDMVEHSPERSSIPLEHSTSGRPLCGAFSSTERMCCAGVTTSQASQLSRSARALVAWMTGESGTPGR